jgi:isopentenyldiphosphate isomerase
MADSSLAQDPDELFDVVRADGLPLGFSKARAEVHRDGDWHRSVHVWVAGRDPDGGGFLLSQRRSLAKDTWPGRLDATVGGHLRAGEGLDEALRETEEEIGVAVTRADLRPLGVRLGASEEEPGILDRELQSIFLLRDDRPLAAYRPHPVELAALVKLPLPPLLDLLAGVVPVVTAEAIAPGELAPRPVGISTDDFIPTVDGYYYRVAIATDRVLRGERHVAV